LAQQHPPSQRSPGCHPCTLMSSRALRREQNIVGHDGRVQDRGTAGRQQVSGGRTSFTGPQHLLEGCVVVQVLPLWEDVPQRLLYRLIQRIPGTWHSQLLCRGHQQSCFLSAWCSHRHVLKYARALAFQSKYWLTSNFRTSPRCKSHSHQ
jgi:hypothetical protein